MQQNKYKFDKEKHVHSLNGTPLMGSSTVVSVIAKYGLEWWSAGEAVKTLGWLHPKKNTKRAITIALNKGYKAIQSMTKEQYKAHLDIAYRAHNETKEDSSFRGTALHTELEVWIKGQMGISKKPRVTKRIRPFTTWAKVNIKRYLWSEAHCYDEGIWTGGVSDVGVELMDGTYAVIDFKSAKEAYTSHFIQAALYGYQIEKNGLYNALGVLLGRIKKPIGALIVFPFGAKIIEPVIKRNVSDFYAAVPAAVTLYKLIRNENEKNKQEKAIVTANRKRARVSKATRPEKVAKG